MGMFARMLLQIHRKLRLCVHPATIVRQVLLHSVGQVTYVNQAPALQRRLMVQKDTFVPQAISVLLVPHLRQHVLQDITILTKVALISLSVRSVQLVQPALTLAHLILHQ
jgi:hypothetical protein